MFGEVEFLRKLRVMIVDGDSFTSERYKNEIESSSYRADFFSDAETALRNYENSTYDLVIANFILPRKTGEAFVFDIKYINPFQKTAVVADADDFPSFKESHEIQIFTKPVNMKNVIESAINIQPLTRSDHRRYPRFKVDLISNLVDDKSAIKTQVKVLNMCLGGLFIGANQTTILESDFFNVEIPILGRPLVLKAKRRWEMDLTESLVGIGAEFYNLSLAEFSALEKYLETVKV